MEKLIIENFGGINSLELNLNQINILIGPQATGKSICAKLLYFFKGFVDNIISYMFKELDVEFNEFFIQRFTNYFPIHTYPDNSFNLRYELNNFFIEIKCDKNKKIDLNYSEYFIRELPKIRLEIKERREQLLGKIYFQDNFDSRKELIKGIQKDIEKLIGFSQLFIPAGRSFFALLQSSIYSILKEKKDIDPFIFEFGSFYENIKDLPLLMKSNNDKSLEDRTIDELIEKILKGIYLHESGNDYLVHSDKRKINLAYSSSGQQETLPLTIILKSLKNAQFTGDGATIYIEEPETHIFPSTQKNIVELISCIFNTSKSELQFFITTHSPYILSSFNNLMYAGSLKNNLGEIKKYHLYKIVPDDFIIDPKFVNAYSIDYNNYNSIINPETNLIDTNSIDDVSNEISNQFDDLLNIE